VKGTSELKGIHVFAMIVVIFDDENGRGVANEQHCGSSYDAQVASEVLHNPRLSLALLLNITT